jgi:cell division protein FtsI (penicillin-binding protein 3)
LPIKDVFTKLLSQKRFVWIKRLADNAQVQEIKSWNESGLKFVEEGRRAYPNQSLLSQVLGFVGAEGAGLEGLEKKYDAELRGEKRAIMSKRDARGRPLVVNGQLFELSGDGATIETTIDKELQYELERQLLTVVEKQDADKAIGIIMDPSTGEVLAMGSYPSYDPGQMKVALPEYRRNKAVTDIFEPGSTFKVVTVAAALRTGRIFPNTKYFCEKGKMKIGKRIIREAESDHAYGSLTLAEILAVSSNIGSTKVAFDVGYPAFREMIGQFGFFSKTGIDFGGEASGLQAPEPWPEHLLSNISFGHGVGVTALQMANAYGTIANGGKLMTPYLVKRVIDSENNIIEQREPKVVRQVLTSKEASTLTYMLTGATETGGTGMMARVDGYPVAGKTGTAQKVNPTGRGYLPGSFISSFAGFVPANNPQFTIYIVVDNPKHEYYGAQVAAPVFHKLASFALHRRGFMPIVVSEKAVSHPQDVMATTKVLSPRLNPSDESIPDFSGLTVRDVAKFLKAHRLASKEDHSIHLIGRGLAQDQWPSPGTRWSQAQKIKVTFKPANLGQ